MTWRAAIRLLVLFCFTFAAHAQVTENFIELRDAELSLSDREVPPELGWLTISLPYRQSVSATEKHLVAWVKFSFGREKLPAGQIAITIDTATERFDAFLNGELLHRNYSVPNTQNFASDQPYLIAIPDALLVPGGNSLAIRLNTDTNGSLKIQGVRVAASAVAKQHFDRHYMAQFLGPQLVNAILIAMTLFALVFWIMRPRELSLGWLFAIGTVWVLRNIHHSMLHSPINPGLVWQSISISTYILLFCLAGFAVVFFGYNRRRSWLALAGGATVLLITVHHLLQTGGIAQWSAVLLLFPAFVFIVAAYARQCLVSPRIDTVLMALAVIAAALAMTHDGIRQAAPWQGIGFALMPYASLMVFAAFSFAISKKLLTALTAKEALTQVLGQRVETTKANLLASESARRSLEISNAITKERERMMREIHDGIGSSLVAALASAERQGRSSTTAVVALKSALTDLRITVDSLEPVEGNVTTLLANLRYRLEPEMRKASIAFEWKVDDVSELHWLDAPNALHVLRIFQEAFGNILGHANATRITVACREETRDGRAGVTIEVSDDGLGFDPKTLPRGRGRKNMLDRAEALGGSLAFISAPGEGSTTMLWLPLERDSF